MTSEIRILFFNLLRICLLTGIIIGLVFGIIPPDSNSYLAESLQQLHLLETIPGRRIILAGGSNVAFGLDARLMQKELGVPVINYGLHAGLGIVPLRELQQYIHEGDIVIISLEYSMFSSREVMNGDTSSLSDWIEFAPSRVKYLSHPLTDIPSIFVVMLQRKLNRSMAYALNGGSLAQDRTIFTSSQFDLNGDFIGHLQVESLPRQKIPASPYPVTRLQKDMFIFLAGFNKTLHTNGATLYFEAQASRQSNCDATGEDKLGSFFDTFKSSSSIPVLTAMDQVCIPDKYFFDTPHHLNAEGRRLKTLRLIEDMRVMIDLGK